MCLSCRRWLLAATSLLLLVAPSCTDDGGSRKAFCAQVAELPPLSGVLTGYDRAEAGELARRLGATRKAYDDLRQAAPGDLEEDTNVMVDLIDEILDAVGEHPQDPEAVHKAVREAAGQHPETGEASERVATYARDRCGVTLTPTTAATTTTTIR